MELKVNQKVWVIGLDHRRCADNSPAEATIAKIGKKYFELDRDWYGRFCIDGLYQDGGKYTPHYRVVTDLQVLRDERETKVLRDLVKGAVHEATLEQLRAIRAILNIELA